MAPRTEDEYREWLEMLAAHRGATGESPQGPPPPQEDQDAIQAEADALAETMLGPEAFMTGGAAMQPTLPAPDPYSFRKDTVYPAAQQASQAIMSYGQPTPEEYAEAGVPDWAVPIAGMANLPDMLARGTLASIPDALQFMADPQRMMSEQPLDAAGAALDVIPGGGAVGAGLAAMLPAAGKLAGALQPIKTVTGRLQRRAMAPTGSLPEAGKRFGWTPQPRGTYSDAIEEAVQKIGPEEFRVPGGGEQMVTNYADRIERALDAGVPIDWFYKPAHEVVNMLARDPEAAEIFAKANAILSANSTPVPMQYGFAVRAMEDAAAGVPLNVGKNPNTMSPRVQKVIDDPGTDLALKTDPFAHGIGASPQGAETEGVNDFWEMLGLGFPKGVDAKGNPTNPNPTTGQHDLLHGVRAEAIAEVANRRGIDLSRHQAQELHWADTRSDVGGNPMPIPQEDGSLAGVTTMQERVPVHRAQHSWETAPGSEVQKVLDQFPEYAQMSEIEKQNLHQAISEVMLDPEGRDRLVDTMAGGFALQEPALRETPGMYTPPGADTPEFNPGTQSRSQVGFKEGAMLPSSADRLSATEMVRSVILGQNAGVASHFNPAGIKASEKNAMRINMGRQATQDDLKRLYELGYTDAVPTEDGVMVLAPFELQGQPPGETAKWAREQLKREGEIGEALGEPVVMMEAGRSDTGGTRNIKDPEKYGEVASTYVEPEWSEAFTEGGGAFKSMIDTLESTGFRQRADSEETRALMGQLADTYEGLGSTGGGVDPRLIETLRTWATQGLPGVEGMIKAGLAPAALLPIILSLQGGAEGDLGA